MIDGRSYSHEVLEHYRFRALELYEDGKKVNDIADFFGVHRCSVSHWISSYKRHGKRTLKSKKSVGPAYKLGEQEMNDLLTLFEEDAMQYGFETPLWTCKRIQHIIKHRFGKKIHTTNIMRWLKRINITHQKPQRQASQRDEKAVKKWLMEEWPKIKAHCRRWQAMLYFQDEAGVSLTPVMGKTWAPRGKTPIVKVTGKRGGLCVTSAISPSGKMIFRIEKKRVNADKHIEFLEKILKQHPKRKIIVVEDRAPAHRAKKVKEFVNAHKKRLAVYYLPSYAPELNPDEHVWEYLKAYQLKAHQAQDTKELKKIVKRKMQGIQRKKYVINSFFVGTYVL
jgi:transposase